MGMGMGGGSQAPRRMQSGQNAAPAPPQVPPPTDPLMAAGQGMGRGPMPGNMMQLLAPQQNPMNPMPGPETDMMGVPGMDGMDGGGTTSIMLKLLQQLGKV